MVIMRNQRQAARARSDDVFALVQIAGRSSISQDGKDIVIENGGLALVDTQCAYTIRYGEASEQLVAHLSRREIEARIGDISHLMAYRVDSGNGTGKLASEFLRSLAGRAGETPSSSHAQLSSHATDLLSLALSVPTTTGPRLSSARMISLLRLKTAIESRLSDSETTCAEIAQAACMSVRYANQLLASEGTLLERLLWNRRLDKCRQAFDDHPHDARTITDIAYGWSFSDMTYFGRLFKARHGMAPRDYRAQSRTTR
jgi:AraC family transcriptional regulator, positive regulator of tynA and feaB